MYRCLTTFTQSEYKSFNFGSRVKIPILKMLKLLLFLNDIMIVILGVMEETQRLALRNIVTIQFYNRYFCSRTKTERFIFYTQTA